MMIYHDLPIKNEVISQFAVGALQWSHQKDEGPSVSCVIFGRKSKVLRAFRMGMSQKKQGKRKWQLMHLYYFVYNFVIC
jgi:hypothetical protein